MNDVATSVQSSVTEHAFSYDVDAMVVPELVPPLLPEALEVELLVGDPVAEPEEHATSVINA